MIWWDDHYIAFGERGLTMRPPIHRAVGHVRSVQPVRVDLSTILAVVVDLALGLDDFALKLDLFTPEVRTIHDIDIFFEGIVITHLLIVSFLTMFLSINHFLPFALCL